jgi:UDPglucose--hexose-1-phosphate uridylyltransferase
LTFTAFTKEITKGRYLDPFDGFKEKESLFEIRRDAITGGTSRILPYRFRVVKMPDINDYLEKSPVEKCPFCPPLFERITPRFTAEVADSGRFRREEAVLFPNAFPHDRHNGVAVFSSRHYLGLDELTPEVMLPGFLVCQNYFARMMELQPDLQFCSINWNYMPPAGGGLVHPHVQTVIGERPTRFMKTIYESAVHYDDETGHDLWQDLIASEKEEGERYIASTGAVHWLVSFAPRGMAGEIAFILPDRSSIFELTDADFLEILGGFTRIFAYFLDNNLISFNMALYATLREEGRFPVQGRIVPRFTILPLGTSDINYFEKLHDEVICPVVPEQVCRDIQPYFQDDRRGGR